MRVLICIVLSFFGMVFFSSCHHDDGPTIIDLSICLWVRDASGKNLLDSTTQGYLKQKDIRVFYLEDGKKKEFYNASLDVPRNFSIFKNDGNGEWVFGLGAYESKSNQTDTTTVFVQWRAGLEDTLKCEITKVGYSSFCTKVWYNDALKFDDATAKSVTWGNGIVRRFIEVRK
jgi:hypothetical protein